MLRIWGCGVQSPLGKQEAFNEGIFVKQEDFDFTKVGSCYAKNFDQLESTLRGTGCLAPRLSRLLRAECMGPEFESVYNLPFPVHAMKRAFACTLAGIA